MKSPCELRELTQEAGRIQNVEQLRPSAPPETSCRDANEGKRKCIDARYYSSAEPDQAKARVGKVRLKEIPEAR